MSPTQAQARVTFREFAGETAWQKQLRDRHVNEGVPPVPHLNVGQAIVRKVTRKLAQQIILKYEWLGTMAPGTSHYYGLFFGNYCAGVCCFGVAAGAANFNAHLELNVDRHHLACLARGANVHWSPKGANSKLVTWACKLLAKETGIKLVIAYSDSDAGEIGTIYQACNWVYIGPSGGATGWVAPNGRLYTQKLAYDLRVRNGRVHPQRTYIQALKDAGWVQQPGNPKHRYIAIMDKSDKALVAHIESLRQPYPKRESIAVPSSAADAAPGGVQ
jgi:hypothetical protein